jgi:hypothetical protein
MLAENLHYILYVVYASFHNLLFFLLLIAIFRLFTVKFTPYAGYFVACYAFIHSSYGGCPLVEIQNYLGLSLGLPMESVGEAYVALGAYATGIRAMVFLSSLLLFYVSYKTWNKVTNPVHWNNIFTHHSFSIEQ